MTFRVTGTDGTDMHVCMCVCVCLWVCLWCVPITVRMKRAVETAAVP